MRLIGSIALYLSFLGTCVFVSWVAYQFNDKMDTIVHHSDRSANSYERCETSMHQYLDNLVLNKGGILTEQPASSTTVEILTDEEYAPPLEAENYP